MKEFFHDLFYSAEKFRIWLRATVFGASQLVAYLLSTNTLPADSKWAPYVAILGGTAAFMIKAGDKNPKP